MSTAESSHYTAQTQVLNAEPGTLLFTIDHATGCVQTLDKMAPSFLYEPGSYQLSLENGAASRQLRVNTFWPFTTKDTSDPKIMTDLPECFGPPTNLQLTQSGIDRSWLVADTAGHREKYDTLVTAKNMRCYKVGQDRSYCQAEALVTASIPRSILDKVRTCGDRRERNEGQ